MSHFETTYVPVFESMMDQLSPIFHRETHYWPFSDLKVSTFLFLAIADDRLTIRLQLPKKWLDGLLSFDEQAQTDLAIFVKSVKEKYHQQVLNVSSEDSRQQGKKVTWVWLDDTERLVSPQEAEYGRLMDDFLNSLQERLFEEYDLNGLVMDTSGFSWPHPNHPDCFQKIIRLHFLSPYRTKLLLVEKDKNTLAGYVEEMNSEFLCDETSLLFEECVLMHEKIMTLQEEIKDNQDLRRLRLALQEKAPF